MDAMYEMPSSNKKKFHLSLEIAKSAFDKSKVSSLFAA
jgi:hypothetical protein